MSAAAQAALALCRVCAAAQMLAQMLSYNPTAGVFGFWRMQLTWQPDGSVAATHNILVRRSQPGWPGPDPELHWAHLWCLLLHIAVARVSAARVCSHRKAAISAIQCRQCLSL